MKKKTLIILGLAVMSVLSCSKTDRDSAINGDDPQITIEGKQKMRFSGKSSETTKATFPNSSGTLHWSAYDHLSVYSVNSSSGEFINKGVAMVHKFAGTNATFESSVDRSTWVGTSSSVRFYAYYPNINGIVPPYVAAATAVDMNVPSTQTGEFGKYQICTAQPVIMNSSEVIAGEDVNFNFTPSTTILRVKVSLEAASDIEQMSIKQLIINIADSKVLAGNCRLNLNDGALSTASGVSTLSITLAEPIAITKNATDNEYITAVILPTNTANAAMSFAAVTVDGAVYALASKLSPVAFEKGKRYSLERTILYQITPETTPDGMHIIGGDAWLGVEVDNDGAYTDGGQGW